ncbi:hybrid sensor histidine kinase/response regulator [Telluribacter humicola]|uniref:hybrid sensor histidine kinase/response regulator n=1 Tax=Telluribacter humicola TaxID=1720261 RepID=UPI001A963D1C|nr:hybrid sensor histidine kinase/response regulator [Telluribacter humicola]
MLDKPINVLLVDDDEDDFLLTSACFNDLDKWNFSLTWCPTYQEAIHNLKTCKHDLYIFDFLLGERNGIDLLGEALENQCEEPIILLTGKGDEKVAVEALRLGAADYLIKSELEPQILERSIRYALERTNVLKALRQSERRYRRVFEESKDMLFISDLKGKVLDFNQAAVQLTGFETSELLNNSLPDMLDGQELKAIWEEIKEGTDLHDREVRLMTKSGEKKYCLMSASVEVDFETRYIQGRFHDITSRKQSERERLFSEKLAVTSRLIRMLAHEVRNPLTNVNLSAEQLESELESEDQKFYTQIIKRNCTRINDLITQLLQSARPSEITLVPQDLHQVLDEALAAAFDRLQLKKIQVDKEYDSVDLTLALDSTSLQIAILNIINNAIEAMDEGTGVLKVTTRRSDQDIQVLIADNGSGISEENMRKIFEPYFTGKKTGMGIGLATTLSIVESHRGRIDVQSEEGVGTVFTMSFSL